MKSNTTSNYQSRLFTYLFIVIIFTCFQPALQNKFVWDDNYYLGKNENYQGLGLKNLKWMFTTSCDGNYHPLYWLSFGLDYLIWGKNLAGYHLTNILLHIVATLLLYQFIILVLKKQFQNKKNFGPLILQLSAMLGSLFFAIYPLRVEPVAWLSSRADLLCGIFYILTLINYFKMNDIQLIAERKKWYVLSILFFLLSALSRAWGITLPVILIVLDFYPLRRLNGNLGSIFKNKLIIIEKIPFFLLGLAAGIIAFFAKKASMINMTEHNIFERFIQSMNSLYFYVLKTLLPSNLSPLYLLNKNFNPFEFDYFFNTITILSITIFLILIRKRWPWALVIWSCYIIIVSPLLGLVQAGPQIRADRYTYISCMPFSIPVGAGIFKLFEDKTKQTLSLFCRLSALLGFVTYLILFWFISANQVKVWYDNSTFWNYVLKLDPTNYFAHHNYGFFLESQGNLGMAYYHYDKAIQFNPDNYKDYNNRGILRNRIGDLKGALEDYNMAIKNNPAFAEAYANRGVLHEANKNYKDAIEDYNKALYFSSKDWSDRETVIKLLNNSKKKLHKQIKK